MFFSFFFRFQGEGSCFFSAVQRRRPFSPASAPSLTTSSTIAHTNTFSRTPRAHTRTVQPSTASSTFSSGSLYRGVPSCRCVGVNARTRTRVCVCVRACVCVCVCVRACVCVQCVDCVRCSRVSLCTCVCTFMFLCSMFMCTHFAVVSFFSTTRVGRRRAHALSLPLPLSFSLSPLPSSLPLPVPLSLRSFI